MLLSMEEFKNEFTSDYSAVRELLSQVEPEEAEKIFTFTQKFILKVLQEMQRKFSHQNKIIKESRAVFFTEEQFNKEDWKTLGEHFTNIISTEEQHLLLENTDRFRIHYSQIREDAKHKSPVKVWNYLAAKYPYMAKVARAIMILPHTSVPVERVFGNLKDFKSSKRNRLTTENLESSLLLYQKYGESDFYIDENMMEMYNEMWKQENPKTAQSKEGSESDIDDQAIQPSESENVPLLPDKSLPTNNQTLTFSNLLRNVSAQELLAAIFNAKQDSQMTTGIIQSEPEKDIKLFKRQPSPEEEKAQGSLIKDLAVSKQEKESRERTNNLDSLEIIYSKGADEYERKNENTVKRKAKESLNQQRYNEQVKAAKKQEVKDKLEKSNAKSKNMNMKDANEMEIEILGENEIGYGEDDGNRGRGRSTSTSRVKSIEKGKDNKTEKDGRSQNKGKKKEKLNADEEDKGKRKGKAKEKSPAQVKSAGKKKVKDIDEREKRKARGKSAGTAKTPEKEMSPEKEKIKVKSRNKVKEKSQEKEKTPIKRRK